MTACELLTRPERVGSIHLTLTPPQALGLLALTERGAAQSTDADPGAVRGLRRLRGAVQGLRPADLDLALEVLGEILGELHDRDAGALFAARLQDLLATARLWRALERAYRRAIRDGSPHAERAHALLRPELTGALRWRVEALDLLDRAGAPHEG